MADYPVKATFFERHLTILSAAIISIGGYVTLPTASHGIQLIIVCEVSSTESIPALWPLPSPMSPSRNTCLGLPERIPLYLELSSLLTLPGNAVCALSRPY